MSRNRQGHTLKTLEEIIRDEEILFEGFEAFFRCTAGVVDRYLQLGAKGEARRQVAILKAEIDKMPEGFWRGEYSRELQERFGHLASAPGDGVRLTPATAREGGE